MVHTFSSTWEKQFRALDKFDLKVVKKFARAANECIINGPISYENFDQRPTIGKPATVTSTMNSFDKFGLSVTQDGIFPNSAQISDADQVREIIENLMFLYLECCKDDVSVEKFKQFLESKLLNSEYAAAIADEYHKNKSKIRDLCSGPNNLLYYLDMQWRLEAKVGSRSLPNQMVPLFSMDFKFGDSSTSVDTKHISHEILHTDPVTLLYISDSLEKALSETRSRNLRKVQKHIKKFTQD